MFIKKLGRKHNIWTLVTDYIDISEFYRKNFIEIRPDVLIVWNGITHSFQTAAVEVAKSFDIPVIFLERGLILIFILKVGKLILGIFKILD